MSPEFRKHLEFLEPRFTELKAMAPVRYSSLPRSMPTRGVYLFTESGRDLYVGRTNNIRRRLQNHCRPSGTHFTATFAFRIARELTGRERPTYQTAGSRAHLQADPIFAEQFRSAKARVSEMDIRFVAVDDAVDQSLMEIYAAITLRTPYNDFENH